MSTGERKQCLQNLHDNNLGLDFNGKDAIVLDRSIKVLIFYLLGVFLDEPAGLF
jgi:hypothetical protein